MSLYTTGTITGALNATTITGTGTKWSDAKVGITNGSVLFVSSNAGVDGVYQVKRVISDTSIELAQPIYKMFTNSKYSILVAESASTAAWANQLAATLGYYQAQMDGWQQIMTGTGDIALTAPDGTKVTIKSFTKMSEDIDKKQDKSDILTDLSKSKDADGVREYLGLSATLNKNTQAGTQHGWAAGNFDDNYYSVFGFSKHNTVSAKKSFNDMPANSSWFGYQTSENPPTPAFNGIFADFAGSSESYRMQLGGKYTYNNGRCLFSLRTLDGDHNSWNPWVVMLTSLPSSSSPTNTNENPLYPSSAFEGVIEAVGVQENVSDTFGMLRVRNKNNTVMGSCYNERGGDWTLAVSTNGISGTEKYYQFLKTGQFVSPGNISCISLTQTCDRDAKYDIETIDDPLSKLDKVNGYTYKFRDTDLPSAGIIAQEFKEILPDIISTKAEPIPQYNEDGDFIGLKANDDLSNLTYGVEPMGVIGFLVAALKAEKSEREKLSRALADLKGKVDLLLSKE
ncbi:MAG: tail fiber domain-containing protein [Hafnia sp.]|uniref:tail fiber domain-containing protein n=1 Tax=Hafnia sp. TaxID=1873498 RepID=UPI002FCB99A5